MGTALRGQIGAVYVWSEALTEKQLRDVWTLGANCELVEELRKLELSCATTLVLALSPKSRSGVEFPNNALPASNTAQETRELGAQPGQSPSAAA